SKLRNAMVVSALQSDVESDVPLKDIPLPLSTDNTDALYELFYFIHIPMKDFFSLYVCKLHALMFVMALFLSVNGSVLQFWDGEGSLPDFLSDHSSVLMDSELKDPQNDQSLLENLFYKAPVSHAELDSEDVQHSEAGDDFSGLSVDKIALLRDIRFARVTISELKVPTESTSRSLSRKGRPPCPLTTKKCFYIVEYLFPLVSAGYEDVQHVPSEITKVVSSKVTEGALTFQHLSMFPVRFSRSSIKQWWEINVTFKLHSRNSLQKTPVLIGSAMFPLNSVMQSESLSISAALPVQRPDRDADKQAFGPLKVSFELAADKNDFSTKKRPAKRMRLRFCFICCSWCPMGKILILNCKLLGSDETARSTVSWSQKHPTFGFIQVAPVTLTSKLLERMKNNMMVIEVCLRASNSDHDKLLGLVKLPLHQFYMSFRDPKITELLLQSQYPVVGVDSYMPVVDVFSGSTRGNLRVCLAMGLAQQITALQRMRDDELTHVSPLPRPAHMLDHQPHVETKHVFMVRVERVKGLTPLQSTVIFFYSAQPTFCCTDMELKAYRSETTLCVPDPVFGHNETHVLLAPPDVPVQRILLSSLASQGLKNGVGVLFEVWCRYYYPNVRDQLVAKGLLPMSKLCAMVTMQKQGQTDAQLFSLPLVPRTDRPVDTQPQPPGLLEVSVQYKSRPMRSVGVKSGVVPSRRVILVVQVHRAAGLQAAAKALADTDNALQYYSEVGLNSFITMQLSFLPDSEVRSTCVAARSFCPEFEHHAEFCCNLLVQRDSGESISLAELLQEAVAVFTINNRDTHKSELPNLERLTDVWRFHFVMTHFYTLEASAKSLALSLSMPRAWLPIHCLLLPGHEDLQHSTYCYHRYKLYNQQTVCSELRQPVPDECEGGEGLATVAFQGSRSVVLRRTQPLLWYLREEKLEVQVWVAFGKEKRVRPHNADRLVGSAFVDLSALAGTLKHHQTISGVYPLFKRSAVNLSAAALRVHITVTTDSVPHEPQSTEELNDSVEDEKDGGLPTTALSRPSQSPSRQLIKSAVSTDAPPSKEISNDDTFIANITVDRAMHLSLKGCPLAERGGGLPSCCVSYATADAPGTVTTALIKDSDCPVWDHQQECSELDDIQRYFSRKLSTPTFPKLSELRGTSRQDEHRDSETDATQLLLKSSQLVGEVNNIIKGEISCYLFSVYLKGILTLHLFQIRQSPAAPENEKLHHSSSDHSSDEDECKEEERDEDEHEDFEETLIQPRTLNEVTSVTDRTSPWTSLLSDPDMGSLESLELVHHHDDTIHTRGMERNSRELLPDFNPQSLTAESQAVDSDSDICVRSETDLETFRSDGTIATDHREQQPSPDGLDGDGALSSISEVEDYEQSYSGLESVEIPNFFLSAHHLEASMRSLRMAPVFPSATTESVSTLPFF
uniref:C2 domain-containing protein 3-like n=1 Tax=Sinocyclocheilus anshuiensis TaxID=1608454 RepID=A0A671SKS9_9TELE